MSASLKNIGAITLFVEDLQRSRTFYQDVFGLKVIYEDEASVAFDFGNTIVNLLSLPGATDLIEPGVVARPAAGACFQLTIWVDNTDVAAAALRMHGVTLLNGPVNRPWGKRTASFLDPDGNLWEVAADLPSAAGL